VLPSHTRWREREAMTTEITSDRSDSSGWGGRLRDAVSRVAPGTPLRQGIDDIIRSHQGALIVIGHPDELSFLYSGGIRIDQPFTPQLVYELAKMDGAIVVDESLTRIAYANVQLMPDPTIPSAETGTRHRTAERVAKQTGVLVVSISQQRETVTIFIGPARHLLDPTFSVFAKANQGLAALETYRRRLDQVFTRLTALEFQGAAVLDDVLVVVQRGEMTARMVREVERDIVELGSEGRLIRARLDELSTQLPEELAAVVADYHAGDGSLDPVLALEKLAALPHEHLLEPETVAEVLGYPRGVNPLDTAVSPRGYRALSHVPRLPPAIIRRLVSEVDGLEALARASLRELEAVEGVGAVRAKEIKESLRRLQEHNLVERYLNL